MFCGLNAIEIKGRDATTDGDHITKEHTRIKAIKNAGFIPIRIMFYYPNRQQAIKIQQALKRFIWELVENTIVAMRLGNMCNHKHKLI